MYVELTSDITIGNFRFGGVNDVRIKRSVHSYVDTAIIKIPSVCRITRKNGKTDPELVTTGKQFADGDKVIIKLGYNGRLREEFRGFVKRRDLNMPLEIECEGYSYQLRKNSVNGSWKSTTVSEVLKKAIEGTDVRLKVVNDIDLVNVLLKDVTGAEVIDFVMKASGGALNAFFIEPDLLWVGLLYLPNTDGITGTNSGNKVKYRLGWNVIKDNSLRERVPNIDVEFRIKNQKTKRKKGTPAPVKMAEAGKIRRLLLQQIKNPDVLAKLKSTLERKQNYTGYEGRVTAFLEPFAQPGDESFITDTRYKEKDGVYFLEGVEVTFSTSGARRVGEIGPKLETS